MVGRNVFDSTGLKFLESLFSNNEEKENDESNFFNMTPNYIEVDNKKKIVALFKKEKLKTNYLIKKNLFKTEIFIYGKKKN